MADIFRIVIFCPSKEIVCWSRTWHQESAILYVISPETKRVSFRAHISFIQGKDIFVYVAFWNKFRMIMRMKDFLEHLIEVIYNYIMYIIHYGY